MKERSRKIFTLRITRIENRIFQFNFVSSHFAIDIILCKFGNKLCYLLMTRFVAQNYKIVNAFFKILFILLLPRMRREREIRQRPSSSGKPSHADVSSSNLYLPELTCINFY